MQRRPTTTLQKHMLSCFLYSVTPCRQALVVDASGVCLRSLSSECGYTDADTSTRLPSIASRHARTKAGADAEAEAEDESLSTS